MGTESNPFALFFDEPGNGKKLHVVEYVPIKPRFDMGQMGELESEVRDTFGLLEEAGVKLPFFHFFTTNVKTRGGDLETGFLEKIKKEGLQKNTNGCFLVTNSLSSDKKEIATAKYFEEHPVEFLENVANLLQKYIFHTRRTNRKQLEHVLPAGTTYGPRAERHTQKGVGFGHVVLVNPATATFRKGIDGFEHFVSDGGIAADQILGFIDVSGTDENSDKDVVAVARSIMETLAKEALADKEV